MSLQTLDRAMAVLRLLHGHPEGLRLVDIQDALKLHKPTAHRLLASMVSHGLADQDPQSRRYALGTAFASLRPAQADPRTRLARLCESSVLRLAEETGDTVLVMARDQLDTVCVARASGSYPIRAITVEVGTRRPLGIGAGGLSILGALPRAEARRIVTALSRRLAGYAPATLEQILRASDYARKAGYAVSDEAVARGVRAVGVCVRDADGVPVAAIGIAAISQRLQPNRIADLVGLLRRERVLLEQEYR